MTNVITSNRITFRSVKENVENFIVVHSYEDNLYVGNSPITSIHYDVFIPDGMDDSEVLSDYRSNNDMIFRVIRVPMFIEALDIISSQIINMVQSAETKDPYFTPDELTVAISSDPNFSRLVGSYLNRSFRNSEADIQTSIEVLDLIQYMKQTSLDSMANQIKTSLGLSMVYPDDPIAFSYATRLLFSGT